jgi:hypothetical protein
MQNAEASLSGSGNKNKSKKRKTSEKDIARKEAKEARHK